MPSMKAAEEFKRQAEQRRRMAELRITYGNALSDCNLRHMRSQADGPGRCEHQARSPQWTRGPMCNAYSWQLSNIYSPPRLPATPMPMPMWERPLASCSLARRYEVLQKRARVNASLMEKVKSSGERQTHRVQFMDG